MKIEFASIGDGTNVQVSLIEHLGAGDPTDGTILDRYYTATHHVNLGGGYPLQARDMFARLEDFLPKPVIGGSMSHLHPYWKEREEVKRKRELQNLESSK